MKRLLVVGAGSIGRRHMTVARKLYPDVVLHAVSSRGLELQDLPVDRCFTELDDALQETPCMAIVASPATLHIKHAERLLQAGIPVLIEKPLAHDESEAKAFSERCQAGKNLGVGYMFRFSPVIKRARDLLQAEALGDLLHVSIDTGQNLKDWRPGMDYRDSVSASKSLGGGVLLELSHELDLIRFLLGEVEALSAHVQESGSLQIDVEDQVDTMMTLASGVALNLHLDMLQVVPRRQWRISGAGAVMKIDLVKQTLSLCAQGETQWQVEDFAQERNALFEAQLKGFVESNMGPDWPGARLVDGLAVLKLVSAMHRSSALGERVKL